MDIQSVKQKFEIIGTNESINRAIEVALRVASTDLSVLVTGESGVGKEFFPKIIHAYSSRKHGNYIAVNCGAIPEGTIDSELFGHEKGSFTGASESRKGYFEVADNGTIFLDEVGELPLSTQVRLLRVLQTGEIIRVGSSKSTKVNVRVVAATNANLITELQKGRFREDLYYRLNTVPISVPPLRERREDIPLLFRKFASDIAQTYRMPGISLDEEAKIMLASYNWPGNIRQLKNVAEQISAVEQSRVITADILRGYLPNYHKSYLPAVITENHDNNQSTDRDLLYKILFDLRADMSEMKKMMYDNFHHMQHETKVEMPTALLPDKFNNESYLHRDIIDSEVVIDDDSQTSLTKSDVQREMIVKALRKHGGKRKDAANELFMSERTLYRKIKELEIDEM